jgi:hypothetical protein
VQPFRKYCLLNGFDDIGLTLRHADKIQGRLKPSAGPQALAGPRAVALSTRRAGHLRQPRMALPDCLNSTRLKQHEDRILPGDGIGTEIVAEAVKVLNVLDLKFEMETALVGGAAYEAHGHPLPEAR